MLPILGIETSGDLCSVAVLSEGKKYSEANLLIKNIHAEMLVPLIEQALDNISLSPRELKTIAVSIGPGSFTGLRIGLSVAKGMALANGISICPVPTMEVWAFGISKILPEGSEFSVILNANVNDVYLASFRVKEKAYEILEEIRIEGKRTVKEKIGKDKILFGNVAFSGDMPNSFLPTGREVAEWTYLFGKDLLTSNIDFLEPEYFMEFVPKIKAKKK